MTVQKPPSRLEQRRKRQALALKANLKRRKEAQRAGDGAAAGHAAADRPEDKKP